MNVKSTNTLSTKPIDQNTRDNWLKVKNALEAAGKTNSPFYLRALVILQGKSDPGPEIKLQKPSI